MNTKITFVELVELMAENTSTSKRVCELFLREFFTTISQALIGGESVKIKGVGTFKVIRVKPRKSVSVSTGNANELPEHGKLTFTPDKSLAEALNQPFAQFETVYLDDAVTDEKLAEIDKKYPSLFMDDEVIPEPPTDLPEPPAPTLNDIPAPIESQIPTISSADKVKPLSPTDETTVPGVVEKTPEAAPGPEKEKEATAEEKMVEKKTEPVVISTPLMGTPIDDPEEENRPEEKPHEEPQKRPHEEEDTEPEDDGFRRPEPRNVYTPTQEQIQKLNKPNYKRWLWIALGVLVAAGLIWLLSSRNGNGSTPDPEEVIAEADTVAAEPEVITDTVTSQIVLSTLSDRYYGSPWFWVYIYEENRSKINDPNNVRPGTVVVIPPAEKYGIDAKDKASLKKAQRLSWEILNGK